MNERRWNEENKYNCNVLTQSWKTANSYVEMRYIMVSWCYALEWSIWISCSVPIVLGNKLYVESEFIMP